jgi:hypothetical protein
MQDQLRRRDIRISLGLALLGGLFMLNFFNAKAAITLIFFNALPQDGRVILLWETATELDNAGFFINRSTEQDSGFQRINDKIISPRGDGISGATYEHADSDVVNGTLYWYKLESIDLNQNSSFFEPVSAIPGTDGTALPTVTPVPTSTSGGSSGTSPTTTSQAYPAPTNPVSVPYPSPTSSTSSFFSEDQTGATPILEANLAGPTATLIPFPTVTILFPTTDTPTSMGDIGVTFVEASTDQDQLFISRVLRFWPMGLILLIWVLIAAWFFITQKHI